MLPLYDSLRDEGRQVDSELDSELLSDLTSTLNSLTANRAEQVALLIVHHLKLQANPFSRSTKREKVPYGIKVSQGGGFSFDVVSLPVELQSILCSYCSL